MGIADKEYREVTPEETVLPVLIDSTGSAHSSAVLPEEALQSILPIELTGHTPTEVGVDGKLLPSPRESVVSGNVQALEKTPVGSARIVKEAIPRDLLSTVSPLSPIETEELPVSESIVPELPAPEPVVPELPIFEPSVPVLPAPEPVVQELPATEPVVQELPASQSEEHDLLVLEPVVPGLPITDPVSLVQMSVTDLGGQKTYLYPTPGL